MKTVRFADEQGLIPKSKLYVHLSGDIETVMTVGTHHSGPVVYIVHSGKMY